MGTWKLENQGWPVACVATAHEGLLPQAVFTTQHSVWENRDHVTQRPQE